MESICPMRNLHLHAIHKSRYLPGHGKASISGSVKLQRNQLCHRFELSERYLLFELSVSQQRRLHSQSINTLLLRMNRHRLSKRFRELQINTCSFQAPLIPFEINYSTQELQEKEI